MKAAIAVPGILTQPSALTSWNGNAAQYSKVIVHRWTEKENGIGVVTICSTPLNESTMALSEVRSKFVVGTSKTLRC